MCADVTYTVTISKSQHNTVYKEEVELGQVIL